MCAAHVHITMILSIVSMRYDRNVWWIDCEKMAINLIAGYFLKLNQMINSYLNFSSDGLCCYWMLRGVWFGVAYHTYIERYKEKEILQYFEYQLTHRANVPKCKSMSKNKQSNAKGRKGLDEWRKKESMRWRMYLYLLHDIVQFFIAFMFNFSIADIWSVEFNVITFDLRCCFVWLNTNIIFIFNDNDDDDNDASKTL